MAKPRLFVEMGLQLGTRITLKDDAHHYLTRVMRLQPGERFEVFNGETPSFNARIEESSKKSLSAMIESEAAPFRPASNVTLAFAPIKKARTDFIVEKAAELGARAIQPVITEYTNSERVREDRLQRHAIEAVEQCGGTYVPPVGAVMSWQEFMAYGAKGQLLFCDEMANTGEGQAQFQTMKADAWTIVIGPEGGFSPKEREALIAAGALRLSLGPRILRADTAAVAALSLWQATHGDWNRDQNYGGDCDESGQVS